MCHLNQESKSLDNWKGVFRWANFHSETDISILTAIAWDASERNLAVMSDKKQVVAIACNYAEGGMQYLYDNFFEDHMQDDQLHRPEKLDIEFNLAQIVDQA